MAETPSKMVDLGTIAPDFKLPDTVSGRMMSLEEVKSDIATVVMFICNHCPFVKHLNKHIVDFADEYIHKGIRFVAISSNDTLFYPDDSPENMKKVAKTLKYPFPYLFDESQEIAKAYKATCTPDFFVYDKNLELVYRGQYDDSRPGNNIPVTGKDLGLALKTILAGSKPSERQRPSIGCNIKWK